MSDNPGAIRTAATIHHLHLAWGTEEATPAGHIHHHSQHTLAHIDSLGAVLQYLTPRPNAMESVSINGQINTRALRRHHPTHMPIQIEYQLANTTL